MKSFFKKLAFVMALAMVVTLAAPAGSALAAEAGVSLQGTKTIVTTYELNEVGATVDFSFQGAPKDWKSTYKWASDKEAVATVDKAGLVTAVAEGTATITITAGADASYVQKVVVTVAPKVEVPFMEAKQTTEDDIYVTFAESQNIPKTGEGLSVFRVFSAEEMSTMTEDDKKGLVVNADGEGYAQWYVVSANATKDTDNKEYSVAVYENFTDAAVYAVVLGDNDQTWEIEGAETEVRFVASVGRPVDLVIVQTQTALAPTETDEAVPAVVKTVFLDDNRIDVTNLYSQDDVEYDIIENEEIGYLSSNNEFTFSESGAMLVSATFMYYDELWEKDITVTSSVPGVVFCQDYADYTGATLYQWSLSNGGDVDWNKPVHSLPAGDEGYFIVVILKDTRGNYLTNYAQGAAKKVAGTDIYATVIDYENYEIPFVNYGFSVKFETLDSNNLLVGFEDAKVYTYTETRSYAAACLYKEDETKIGEIGVMPINVTPERDLDYFTVSKNSLSLLKESEAEDGVLDVYHNDFCVGNIEFKTFDQYNKQVTAADGYDYEFTVTPTKNAKNEYVIMLCDRVEAELNAGMNDGYEKIWFDSNEFGDLTSASFKVVENNTKKSEVITIAISEPKYNEDDSVYVDATRAVLGTKSISLWVDEATNIKLYQVSKSGQKVGFFRTEDIEANGIDGIEDNGNGKNKHGYYISNYLFKDVSTNIYTLVSKAYAKALITGTAEPVEVYAKNEDGNFVLKGLSSQFTNEYDLRKLYFKNMTQTDGTDIEVGDYVLFVTDPKGKAFTAPATSGALGLTYDDGGIAINVQAAQTVATGAAIGYTEFAEVGTYKVNVYKVDKVNYETGKISYKSVTTSNFSLGDYKQNVKYYHQTAVKSVDYSLSSYENVIRAIEDTMTFTVNGYSINWKETWGDSDNDNGVGFWVDEGAHLCGDNNCWWHLYNIEIADYDHEGNKGVTYIEKDGYVTINKVTFRVYINNNEDYYETTVNVGKSIYEAE